MDCNELVELVTDYLENSLDPAVRARFDAHLGECDGCENYVEQFRATIATLGRMPADRLDPDFRKRLLETFSGWQPDQR
ncbi:MAG: zf-HC2 domain-containing protein [Mycobacteriaceae bacterium]|nr:zf-HC2 domain-containing protein [Mycobacteriaceae bacterium]